MALLHGAAHIAEQAGPLVHGGHFQLPQGAGAQQGRLGIFVGGVEDGMGCVYGGQGIAGTWAAFGYGGLRVGRLEERQGRGAGRGQGIQRAGVPGLQRLCAWRAQHLLASLGHDARQRVVVAGDAQQLRHLFGHVARQGLAAHVADEGADLLQQLLQRL